VAAAATAACHSQPDVHGSNHAWPFCQQQQASSPVCEVIAGGQFATNYAGGGANHLIQAGRQDKDDMI